jgi:hypothetical protein
MQQDNHSDRSRLWIRWLVANVVGFALGGVIGGEISGIGEQPYSEVVISAAEGGHILAINAGVAPGIFGALVGAAYWVALRGEIHHAGWWTA